MGRLADESKDCVLFPALFYWNRRRDLDHVCIRSDERDVRKWKGSGNGGEVCQTARVMVMTVLALLLLLWRRSKRSIDDADADDADDNNSLFARQ